MNLWDNIKSWFSKLLNSKEESTVADTPPTAPPTTPTVPRAAARRRAATTTTTTITSEGVADKEAKILTADDVNGLVEKLVEAKLDSASHKLREDFLTIFGLFAAFLAFIVIEVQVFVQVHRFALLMGFSSFFLASLILFVLSLHNIAKGRNGWGDFLRPIFWLIAGLMFFAFECFWYATHSNQLWHP
jgi:hypothetical protein